MNKWRNLEREIKNLLVFFSSFFLFRLSVDYLDGEGERERERKKQKKKMQKAGAEKGGIQRAAAKKGRKKCPSSASLTHLQFPSHESSIPDQPAAGIRKSIYLSIPVESSFLFTFSICWLSRH